MDHVSEGPIETMEVLLTAQEAFPAFEKLFLNATREIWCGFRVFDLMTKLRSEQARAIGETWFDLFRHTLDRGVSINIAVSDFDPIIGTKYHRKSWETAKQLTALSEVTEPERLSFRISQHPAQAGIVPRTFLRKRVRKILKKHKKDEYTPGLDANGTNGLYDLWPVTHHQKLAAFDRETLYIGGLDLNERRFDTPRHDQPAAQTWQDVQVIVTGPVVTSAQTHLETFERVTAGKSLPAPESEGFVRTLSSRRRFAPFRISPRTVVSEIEAAHEKAIREARHLIYLETQFFRHQPLADSLAKAAENPDLYLVIVLPAAPEVVAFEGSNGQDAKMGEHLQAEAIACVREAFGDRALFVSPARPTSARNCKGKDTLEKAPIVYVHSKVSIFDDSCAFVTSANLNGRSLRWDTEAGVHLTQPDHVERLRKRIFQHWMPHTTYRPVSEASTIVNDWREEISRNENQEPEERKSFLLFHDDRSSREFGEPLGVVPNELV